MAKSRAAMQLGRLGGKARGRNLTKAQRIEAGRAAAKARWAKQAVSQPDTTADSEPTGESAC